MIKIPTCLVLGAGASIPYGFPSGRDLYNEILTGLGQGTHFNWKEKLVELGIEDFDYIVKFERSLFFSGFKSIDSFLEYRPEFMDIGKLCICLSLIPAEQESRLFALQDRQYSWYEYLFNCLLATRDEFIENKLSIITFNYDRSLEYYLYTTIKNAFGLEKEIDIVNLLKSITILHVYGQLGWLRWQDSRNGRSYSPTVTNEQILEASRQIKILTDKEDSNPVFRKAIRKLESSKRIFFLGFGYNEINMKRLRINELKECTVRGTSYKLGKAEIRSVKEKEPKLRLANSHFDIMKFFREVVSLC